MIRGIRGAISISENESKEIHDKTGELLKEIMKRNELEAENIVSIFITATPDLNADFPAYAVRDIGLRMVPVICSVEINVPGAMEKVVRVMIQCITDRKQNEIKHVYLGEAAKLRPDLMENN